MNFTFEGEATLMNFSVYCTIPLIKYTVII